MRLYHYILALFIISITFSSVLSGQVSLQNIEWRGIGPANPGGRIVDIEAVEKYFKQVFELQSNWIQNVS